MYTKLIPDLTYIALVLCSATVSRAEEWPNSDEDPLMFISNPVEAEIPGHWIPLSIVKAILQRRTTALPRLQSTVTKTDPKSRVTRLHTSKPNPLLEMVIKEKKKDLKKLKGEVMKEKSEKDEVIKEISKEIGNIKDISKKDEEIKENSKDEEEIKEKSKEDEAIKEKSKQDADIQKKSKDDENVKENKQDSKVENKETEENKTEPKEEEPEQEADKGEITDKVVEEEYELDADDPIPSDGDSEE